MDSRVIPAELRTLPWTQHPAGPHGSEPTGLRRSGPGAGPYLVPLPLHLLQLQHDGVHAVLVHLAVLPQRRALQLQVLPLLQVLRAQGEINTRVRLSAHRGREPFSSCVFPEPAGPSPQGLAF